MKCALCGYEFDPAGPEAREKCPGCPFAKKCRIICCPECGYGTPCSRREWAAISHRAASPEAKTNDAE